MKTTAVRFADPGLRLVLAALVLTLGACSETPEPEQLVHLAIEQAEQLARQRDRAGLMEMVDADYAGPGGHDRQALSALLRFHFLRNRSVHLLTRIETVAITGPERATATVLVALAGQPIADVSELYRLRVDLLRLELLLLRSGEHYRLLSARWQRAGLADFLP